ncbi:MAG: YybH family protein [Gemmatimonadota bacterium]
MRYAMLAVTLLALAIPASVHAQMTAADGEAEARAVVEGFSEALAAGDSVRALSYLHPDLVVHEGGHAETLDEYRAHHLGADMAFLAAVEQDTREEHLEVRGETALYLSVYTMSGTYRDRDVDLSGTETLVLVRTTDGWKIRHIHWSSR